MEISLEDDSSSSSSSPNLAYKAAHQAFRDRWKETDDSMCRHSMSFHLHHTLRSEFFASYLYLLEKIPVGKKKGHTETSHQSHSQEVKIYNLSWPSTPWRIGQSWRSMLVVLHVWLSTNHFTLLLILFFPKYAICSKEYFITYSFCSRQLFISNPKKKLNLQLSKHHVLNYFSSHIHHDVMHLKVRIDWKTL